MAESGHDPSRGEQEAAIAARRGVLASLGALGAAFLGALCCIGPLLFVTFGVGAGLASTFEPLRPAFGVLMVAALAFGFYATYGNRASGRGQRGAACARDQACFDGGKRKRDEVILWTATILALVLWSFPTWSRWLI
ncbi:MAG: mercuric transporter MerT family protein [Longimicrobiales bacterium]